MKQGKRDREQLRIFPRLSRRQKYHVNQRESSPCQLNFKRISRTKFKMAVRKFKCKCTKKKKKWILPFRIRFFNKWVLIVIRDSLTINLNNFQINLRISNKMVKDKMVRHNNSSIQCSKQKFLTGKHCETSSSMRVRNTPLHFEIWQLSFRNRYCQGSKWII